METTDIKLETPLAAEIPENEIGHSLLALIQTHTDAGAASVEEAEATVVREAAVVMEAAVIEPAVQSPRMQTHSLRMAEMYLAIGELLELLHARVVENPPASGSAEGIHELIQASEERQCSTIEAALKQWESERKAQEAERMIHMETLQVQAQIEVNRLLRVMWLGTGLAAAGAGIALFLMRT
jgi:hypothetical protein